MGVSYDWFAKHNRMSASMNAAILVIEDEASIRTVA